MVQRVQECVSEQGSRSLRAGRRCKVQSHQLPPVCRVTSPVPLPDIGHEGVLHRTYTGWGWPGHGMSKLLKVKERLFLSHFSPGKRGRGICSGFIKVPATGIPKASFQKQSKSDPSNLFTAEILL